MIQLQMPNKYDKEIDKDQLKRDALILAEITAIYNAIRDKSRLLSTSVVEKAGNNTTWFSDRAGRKEAFAKKVNKNLRPDYLKRDRFSKNIYAEEYRTSYFMAKYGVENQGISQGYKFKLHRYQKKQFQKALNYPLSKLMNDAAMKTGRSLDIQQVYNTIVAGVEQGQSLQGINRDIDIKLGFRNAKGQWIQEKAERKGQQYRTQRILRTEVNRMRNRANADQYVNQQSIVESNLILIETLDNRTRSQSIGMDGQKANKEGKFRFPNGNYAYAGESGVAKWDVNDRSSTANVDPEYPPETRIARDKDGKNKIIPYQNAETWAKESGLQRNKYGELLYGKKPIKTVKSKVIKPKTVKPIKKTAPTRTVKPMTPKPTKLVKPVVPTKTVKPISNKFNIKDRNKITSEALKLKDKKSIYGMNIVDNISKEFNVTQSRVLNIEAAYMKKFPRRKLNIDQLRKMIVGDLGAEVNELKRLLK